MDYQITCITKPNRLSPYDRILAVGGPGFRFTVAEVIFRRAAGDRFWTSVYGHQAEVIVINDANGPYIKTTADSLHHNNLLSLPECP